MFTLKNLAHKGLTLVLRLCLWLFPAKKWTWLIYTTFTIFYTPLRNFMRKMRARLFQGYSECSLNIDALISQGDGDDPLHWRHNGRDGVSNHQPHGCLLNRLFRRRSKKTTKLRVTGLCAGNWPGPVNSPHKGPVMRKMFPFDDVIMLRMSTILNNS